MKNVFNGGHDATSECMREEGKIYGISMGRRAPMHKMHVDCILEIAKAGLKPVIIIGSVNGAGSALYDPVRNPMTVEQQKEQFRHALPCVDYDDAMIITLEDNPDDSLWLENLAQKIKESGMDGTSVIHFRSKAADTAKMNEPIKPLRQYVEAFTKKGLAVWQSYNADPADDNISATDIRSYDLERLTHEQRSLIAAPDYLVSIARQARDDNPDKGLLDAHNVPLTVLDLAFDRMRKEAGIPTSDIVKAAVKTGDVTAAGLTKAAADIIKKTRHTREQKALRLNKAPKRPLLFIGNSVSPETTEILKRGGPFDVANASIGEFQSGEPFVEIFYNEKADFAANAERIKGAKAFVVQSTAQPVSDHIQHLLEMTHTLKWYGASEVTAIIPFAALSRQDRSFENRFTSVGADLVAKQLKAAGVDKVVSFSMHSQAAIQFYRNAFGGGFTHLTTTDVFAGYLRDKFCLTSSKLVSGAPDGADKLHDEGQKRARELSAALTGSFNENSMFRISKVHTANSETKITSFDGNVADKDCIVIDDMIDGGSTMINAARMLKEHGAKSVTCCATHPVLTKGASTALEKMMTAQDENLCYVIDNLVMTDAIPEAADKIEAFGMQYPALADKVVMIPLGSAILAEIKKQLTAAPANENKVRAKVKTANRKPG